MPKNIKKTILLLTPFCPPSVGGAETHLQDLYEYLRNHGYFTYVLTYQPITVPVRGLPIERKNNLEIHRFNWLGHNLFHKFEKFPPIFNFLYLTPYLLIRSFIFMLNHKDKVDVIHAHGLNASFMAAFLKKIFKKRAVMSTMALYSFSENSFFSRITAWVLNSLDKIIAETEESRDELTKIGVSKEKIVVFSHWVDQNKFKPENKELFKKKVGWEGKFVALFVGRAIPIKGGDTLTEVVKKIHPKINIAVVSDAGPLLQLFSKTSNLFNNFIFVGGVPYENLHWYYKAADIFIIPSRYEEGAARVMMEAVSCGLPVIASNRGAIPSVLNDSVAIFVDPGADEIKEKIEFLYRHPKRLAQMAKNCYLFGIEKFGFKNVEVILAAYEN